MRGAGGSFQTGESAIYGNNWNRGRLHRRFRRSIGVWANIPVTPDGKRISQQAYDASIQDWIPSQEDRDYVKSLMVKMYEPGKMVAWIAPPDRGINNLSLDYEYVTMH